MTTGFTYAWRNRVILALLTLSALPAILGRSYQNLLPIFARDIWHGGPEGYGLLLSAAGGGALIGAFGLASIRQVGRQETRMRHPHVPAGRPAGLTSTPESRGAPRPGDSIPPV